MHAIASPLPRPQPRLQGLLHLACLGLSLLSLCLHLPAQRITLADGNAEPITARTASVQVEIVGRFAITTFDLVFHNPNPRQLEGTFELPLLDGQSIVRFALDINGTLREAVPVEKEKGRVVFEEIERRRVDPGLLEKTEGNFYRARIFPLPAKGTRHILIAFQEELPVSGPGARYRLQLPFENKLKDFSLKLSVATGPGLHAEVRDSLGLGLDSWNSASLLEVHKSDFKASGLIEVTLPPLKSPATSVASFKGKDYFLTEIPHPESLKPVQRPAPRVIGLLWDSSGSGAQRAHELEFALLDSLFKKLGKVEVRLYRIRNSTTLQGKPFRLSGGRWSDLREELENTAYDGASSLDGLPLASDVDEWLLFSDGLLNFGNFASGELPELKAPLHSLCASAGANTTWLRNCAARNGGEFVNLLACDTAGALQRLREVSPRLLQVDYRRSEAAHLLPEPGFVIEGGALKLCGELRKPGAELTVLIGTDRATASKVSITLPDTKAEGLLPARAWAAARIAQLSLDATRNKASITATSRDFGIVSDTTSLIVLETVQDYVRYEITPPQELLAQYTELRRFQAATLAKDTDRHLNDIVSRFQGKLAWWEKDFPKDTPTTKNLKKAGRSNRISLSVSADSETVQGRSDEEAIILSPFFVASEADRGFSYGKAKGLAPAAAAGNTSGYKVKDSLAGTRTDIAAPAPALTLAAGTANESAPRPPSDASFALKAWSPDNDYIERLRRAPIHERRSIYLEERQDHALEPGFYMECADFFFSEKEPEDALQILSNLAELAREDAALLRILGGRLLQASRADLARPIFEKVLRIRHEEPQSLRDLALACADLGQSQRAVDLLWELVSTPWHNRFPDIELIALTELNAILASGNGKLDTSAIDPRLLHNLPSGLRVVLTWDTDNCDIDLWVRDPNGEATCYNNQLSYQGGRMSRDFTGGYGPEEFMLRNPKAGNYRFNVNYFGDNRQTLRGPVTALVTVYTDFGTPNCKRQYLTLQLKNRKQDVSLGSIKIN